MSSLWDVPAYLVMAFSLALDVPAETGATASPERAPGLALADESADMPRLPEEVWLRAVKAASPHSDILARYGGRIFVTSTGRFTFRRRMIARKYCRCNQRRQLQHASSPRQRSNSGPNWRGQADTSRRARRYSSHISTARHRRFRICKRSRGRRSDRPSPQCRSSPKPGVRLPASRSPSSMPAFQPSSGRGRRRLPMRPVVPPVALPVVLQPKCSVGIRTASPYRTSSCWAP